MSISDMMSGLMLVFLFIAISFMIEVEKEKETMKNVAQTYRDTQANLNEILHTEFEKDLQIWGAHISKDNTITFDSPNTLFEVNKSTVSEKYKLILKDFFPRYIKILNASPYKEEIKEIRIQGHTSKVWTKFSTPKEIYLNNMRLSQNRAYEVLSFCYSLPDLEENRPWLEKFFRANGMAYAKLKEEKTRRVTFSIQLKSEEKVYEILK